MNSEHALYSPSSAATWLNCEAGHFYNLTLPDNLKFEKYAKEGIALHKYASEHINCALEFEAPSIEKFAPEICNYTATKFLSSYFRYIDENPYEKIWVESKVSLIDDLVWGTADLIFYRKGSLEIVDLKTGFNEVMAANNPQLAIYALAAAKTFKLRNVKTIKMTIVQPKLNKIESQEMLYSVLRRTWLSKIIKRVEYLENYSKGKMELVQGPFCKYCKGADICPLIKKFLL